MGSMTYGGGSKGLLSPFSWLAGRAREIEKTDKA